MVQNSSKMLSSLSFGNSQPLKPVADYDVFELQNKANETKVSVLDKLIKSLEKCQAKKIERSTPHFGGLCYKA